MQRALYQGMQDKTQTHTTWFDDAATDIDINVSAMIDAIRADKSETSRILDVGAQLSQAFAAFAAKEQA